MYDNFTAIDFYNLPMKIVEKIDKSVEYIGKKVVGVDKHYRVFFYFTNLARIDASTNNQVDITGRGETYREACIDFLEKCLQEKYNLRVGKGYGTDRIRTVINHANFHPAYDDIGDNKEYYYLKLLNDDKENEKV